MHVAKDKGEWSESLPSSVFFLTLSMALKMKRNLHAGGIRRHAHLNKDKVESDLSVPGIQGRNENALL